MCELAAVVGNRPVMSYEASKFRKNVWDLYGIFAELLLFGGIFFCHIQNAFVSLPMP